MGTVLEEIIRDEKGESIGRRELINEIRFEKDREQCIMREVIRLNHGRMLINRILHSSEIHREAM